MIRGGRIGLAALGCVLCASGVAARPAPEIGFDRAPAVYRPDERPRLHFKTRVKATLIVEDWLGREVRRQTMASAGRTLALDALPAGYYEIAVASGGRTQRLALASVEAPSARSRTFGVMTHFAQGWDTDIVPSIARAGIGTVRDEQYWAQIEPHRGQYARPERYARYMEALRGHGIEALPVLSFGNRNYDDGHTPHSATGRAAFAAYGAELARRYPGRLSAVEVWNEINGTFCDGPCRSGRAGIYAALLAQTYAALKAENPGLVVVGGAAVKVPLPWFEALIERGAARHWDAVAVHPYMEPEDAGRSIDALRRLLVSAGSDAPIWATEFGTGAGRSDVQDRRETAAYLVRMAVVLRAAGVERLYWYLLRDYDTFKGMGLLREENDSLGRYAPTPAYTAYATLIGALEGADGISRVSTDPRTHIYRVQRGGETTHVLWAPDGPVPATVELPDGGVLTDLVGGQRVLPPGARALTLDRFPQYLQGVTRLDSPRPDVLLAETGADSDPAVNAANSWYAGAYSMPPASAARDLCPSKADAPEALQRRSNAWEYFHGDPRWPALRVGEGDLHPAAGNGQAIWAVRGYHVAAPGTLRISGTFSRDGQGDGSGACIFVDGARLFQAVLPPGPRQRRDFDLRVKAHPGSRIEFVATPGAGLSIDFDALGLRVGISRWSGDE